MPGYFIVTFDDPRVALASGTAQKATASSPPQEKHARKTRIRAAEGAKAAYIYSVGFKGSIEYDVTAEPVDPNANLPQWSPDNTVNAYLDEDDDSDHPLIVEIAVDGDAGEVVVDIDVSSVGGSEYDTDSDTLTLS